MKLKPRNLDNIKKLEARPLNNHGKSISCHSMVYIITSLMEHDFYFDLMAHQKEKNDVLNAQSFILKNIFTPRNVFLFTFFESPGLTDLERFRMPLGWFH